MDPANPITKAFQIIEHAAIDESIQDFVRDLKATQHGDRTNPVYDYLKDYHKEGSVWRHTLLTLDSLPSVLSVLGYPNWGSYAAKYSNDLRSAALYHDIGKIVTQQPSTTRSGSYSFPDHAAHQIVVGLLRRYDLTPSSLAIDLITHHHNSPEQFATLGWPDYKKALLIILKAADNMAVGPRSAEEALVHVKPFMEKM